MISVSVKIDKILNRKIKAIPVAENDSLFRVEVDRRVLKRPGQSESFFDKEEILELVAEHLGVNDDCAEVDPEPPVSIPCGTPVIIKSYSEDLMPRRRKTWTTSIPFLDFRGTWRVFVLGEDQAVELSKISGIE